MSLGEPPRRLHDRTGAYAPIRTRLLTTDHAHVDHGTDVFVARYEVSIIQPRGSDPFVHGITQKGRIFR